MSFDSWLDDVLYNHLSTEQLPLVILEIAMSKKRVNFLSPWYCLSFVWLSAYNSLAPKFSNENRIYIY